MTLGEKKSGKYVRATAEKEMFYVDALGNMSHENTRDSWKKSLAI